MHSNVNDHDSKGLFIVDRRFKVCPLPLSHQEHWRDLDAQLAVGRRPTRPWTRSSTSSGSSANSIVGKGSRYAISRISLPQRSCCSSYDEDEDGRLTSIQLRNRCEQMSQLLDWKHLGKAYVEARNLALERVYGASDSTPDLSALNMYVIHLPTSLAGRLT